MLHKRVERNYLTNENSLNVLELFLMINLVEILNLMINFIKNLYRVYPVNSGLFLQKVVNSINLMERQFEKYQMKVKT